MKTFFVAAITACGFFVGYVEGHQHADQVFCQFVSHNERQILVQNCQQIRAIVAEHFARIGGPFGCPGNSSAFPLTVKREITNYLQSVGTTTAAHLLNEFQANGFRDFI